jgi:hypothetical protein
LPYLQGAGQYGDCDRNTGNNCQVCASEVNQVSQNECAYIHLLEFMRRKGGSEPLHSMGIASKNIMPQCCRF